eukprot:m.70697 g.70697  ORF g.70697 m.70697 type:complete len:410 (+) comp14317_c1_seq1:2224-3453(+)
MVDAGLDFDQALRVALLLLADLLALGLGLLQMGLKLLQHALVARVARLARVLDGLKGLDGFLVLLLQGGEAGGVLNLQLLQMLLGTALGQEPLNNLLHIGDARSVLDLLHGVLVGEDALAGLLCGHDDLVLLAGLARGGQAQPLLHGLVLPAPLLGERVQALLLLLALAAGSLELLVDLGQLAAGGVAGNECVVAHGLEILQILPPRANRLLKAGDLAVKGKSVLLQLGYDLLVRAADVLSLLGLDSGLFEAVLQLAQPLAFLALALLCALEEALLRGELVQLLLQRQQLLLLGPHLVAEAVVALDLLGDAIVQLFHRLGASRAGRGGVEALDAGGERLVLAAQLLDRLAVLLDGRLRALKVGLAVTLQESQLAPQLLRLVRCHVCERHLPLPSSVAASGGLPPFTSWL